MPKHTQTVILPYPKKFVYNLVKDVASYPDFLPWCQDAKIIETTPTGFIADLFVGFGIFKDSFRSNVTTTDHEISVEYINGPFKHLNTSWVFYEKDSTTTEITFNVDFSFESPLMEMMMNTAFTSAFTTMMEAFHTRAAALWSGVTPQNNA